MKKKIDLVEVFDTGRKQFNCIHEVVQPERALSLEDRRFVSVQGAMWYGYWHEQYKNKPMFEFNMVQQSLNRIEAEYKNNQITADFVSRDGDTDDQTTEACDMLYRADEQDSVAQEAYDNAFQEASAGGYGAWRLRAELNDEFDMDNEFQRIKFEIITDADTSVFFDLNAKRQDKADAKHCFVLTGMTKEAYEEEYDEDPSSWPQDIANDGDFDWVQPDLIYIAEYYVVESTKEVLIKFETIDGQDETHIESDLDEDDFAKFESIGTKETSRRNVKRKVVNKYILNGMEVLEGPIEIAGGNIPIVPVYGRRRYIDNIERSMGHVRLAKDANRLFNINASYIADISSKSPVSTPIFAPEQMEGNIGQTWANHAVENYAFLPALPLKDAGGNIIATGPVAYTKAPELPPAMVASMQFTETAMDKILGVRHENEQVKSNIARDTAELMQAAQGLENEIYLQNMSKAIRRGGEIWLGMATELYVEDGRVMKGIGAQGEMHSIEINRPVMIDDIKSTENDLTKARLDVAVTVGPSSKTQRAAMSQTLVKLRDGTQDQGMRSVLDNMILMQMDGEGMSDLHKYARKKLVALGAVTPTEQEQADIAKAQEAQEPDANEKFLIAEAGKAEAGARKLEAETIETIADTEKTKVEIEKIEQDMDIAARQPIGATQ